MDKHIMISLSNVIHWAIKCTFASFAKTNPTVGKTDQQTVSNLSDITGQLVFIETTCITFKNLYEFTWNISD